MSIANNDDQRSDLTAIRSTDSDILISSSARYGLGAINDNPAYSSPRQNEGSSEAPPHFGGQPAEAEVTKAGGNSNNEPGRLPRRVLFTDDTFDNEFTAKKYAKEPAFQRSPSPTGQDDDARGNADDLAADAEEEDGPRRLGVVGKPQPLVIQHHSALPPHRRSSEASDVIRQEFDFLSSYNNLGSPSSSVIDSPGYDSKTSPVSYYPDASRKVSNEASSSSKHQQQHNNAYSSGDYYHPRERHLVTPKNSPHQLKTAAAAAAAADDNFAMSVMSHRVSICMIIM